MSVSRLVVSVIVLVGNLTLVSTPAAAAVLLVNGSGMTGATDVNVGGTLYDVEFVDGTCAAVFTGCDSVKDFTFTTEQGARDASEALLNQVFLDTGLGDFDSQPGLTFGCSPQFFACDALTPYAFLEVPPGHDAPPGTADDTALFFGEALNFLAGVDADLVQISGRFPFPDTTNTDINAVYARWTEHDTAPVPEPATVTLLGLGLAGMGARRWRQRKP